MPPSLPCLPFTVPSFLIRGLKKKIKLIKNQFFTTRTLHFIVNINRNIVWNFTITYMNYINTTFTFNNIINILYIFYTCLVLIWLHLWHPWWWYQVTRLQLLVILWQQRRFFCLLGRKIHRIGRQISPFRTQNPSNRTVN